MDFITSGCSYHFFFPFFPQRLFVMEARIPLCNNMISQNVNKKIERRNLNIIQHKNYGKGSSINHKFLCKFLRLYVCLQADCLINRDHNANNHRHYTVRS